MVKALVDNPGVKPTLKVTIAERIKVAYSLARVSGVFCN